MNKKIIAPIIMAGSLALVCVGTTFALFTSRAESDIHISAGKVDVKANIKNYKLYSGIYNESTGEYDSVEQTEKFYTGGTATLTANTLTLTNIAPMDKVEFDIEITSESSIDTKYRTVLKAINDDGLFSGLNITVDGTPFLGLTAVTKWTVIPASVQEVKTVHISVELPEAAGNEYQDKSVTLQYVVDAIQANAHTEDVDDDTFGVYTASDLRTVSRLVKSNLSMFKGKTVKLMENIDLNNVAFDPINVNVNENPFTFDGNGKTISNLKVAGEKAVGLFSHATSLTIKDVTVDGAEVSGINHVGVIVGNGLCTKISNCVVKDATVVTEVKNNDDGDKAGAIVGYLSGEPTAYVVSCSAEDVVVKGYRDIGGLVGYANGKASVTDSSVTNATLINDQTVNYKNYTSDEQYGVGEVVGHVSANATVLGNTATNVEIKKIVPCTPSNVAEKVSEAKDGDAIALTKSEQTYVLPTITNKELTFVGDVEHPENVKVDNSTGAGMPGAKLNFEGVTVAGKTSEAYVGYQHVAEEYFEGCVFTGHRMFYGNKTTIKNCTFQDGPKYFFWVYNVNATVSFEGCTFNSSNGYAAKIYNESTDSTKETKVSFKDCTFNAPAVHNCNKPAIAVNSLGMKYDITITNCVATNFKVDEDAPMHTWYQTRMGNATNQQKMLIGCEGVIANIKVNIDGTNF